MEQGVKCHGTVAGLKTSLTKANTPAPGAKSVRYSFVPGKRTEVPTENFPLQL